MFPEVPIALRLSGHLLLGVVRIYSKKVDYLYHDCNEVLSQTRMMFASVHVNLPEDADRATFQAVTLPDTFQLDAMELDIHYQEASDNHLKDFEQITLPDQIPIEGDSYVAFFINEDRFDSSPQPELPNPSAGPMNEEIIPPEVDGHEANAILGGDTAVGSPHRSANADQTTGNLSPIEIARAAPHNFELDNLDIPEVGGLQNNILEPDGSVDQSRNKEGIFSPIGLPISGEESLPFLMRENSPAVPSLDASGRLETGVSPGGQSLGMELPPSPVRRRSDRIRSQSLAMELPPSPPVTRQNARPRKRKGFDKSIVLSNAEIKRQLEDTSKLLHKRQKHPSLTLDVWKVQKHKKKDQIFNETLLCGMCINLQEVNERVFPPTKNASSNDLHEVVVEMEQARFNTIHDPDLPEAVPSPFERELTPITSMISTNPSVPKRIITPELEMPPSLEIPTSAEPLDDGTETPSVNLEESPPAETRLSPEVPGLLNGPEEDLFFLDAENTPSPSGYESRKFDSMSARTRLVAQYFKDQSPMTQLTNDQSGNLSLNKILEGRTRKQCARMFFETLVLKSCDLIDVQQEEVYGDISISVRPTLSKLAM